jgi:hypothetical protein
MENSLLSLAEKLSPDVSYCVVWLDDNGILFDHKSNNVNEMIEMLYLMCQSDVIINSVCDNLNEADAAILRDSVGHIKDCINGDDSNTLDTLPLLKPISMSKQ